MQAAVETTLEAPPADVYAFLADLANHWQLTNAWLEVEELTPDGNGAEVVVRGPLGISRRGRTRLRTRRRPDAGRPGIVAGTARDPAGTTARVTWRVEPRESGSTVRLEAAIDDARGLDRLLLLLGGSWWLRRALGLSLRQLTEGLGQPRR